MPTVNGKSYPYTPEGRAEAKKAAAPKYVQPGIDPNTTAASIAAQQNVRPANQNQNSMANMNAPFKMKGHTLPGPFQKKSPAKGKETWSTEDDREMTAQHNKKHEDGTWDADHKTQMDKDREEYEYKPE